MSHFLPVIAALLLFVSPAFAGTYVWNGAVSDRFSDAANWSGGSPASDPLAELAFPSTAARTTLVNDLQNLTVRSIAFSGSGYTIGGQRITLAAATISDATEGQTTISCDLHLAGNAMFVSVGDIYRADSLTLSGRISGTGTVTKAGTGPMTLTGTMSNTYAGPTHVADGELRLMKPANVTAIPGDLVIDVGRSRAEVLSLDFEQIADSATVRIGSQGVLRLARNERIGPLIIARGGSISMSANRSGTISYTGALILGGDIEVLASGRGADAQIIGGTILPATRTITVRPDSSNAGLWLTGLSAYALDAGVIVRGVNEVDISGSYAGPTIVDGPLLQLSNPNSAVTVRSGAFHGDAASVVVEGGNLVATTFPPVLARGELRLTAAAKVPLTFLESNLPRITANSVILGNAKLELAIDDFNLKHTPGKTYLILDNRGAAPIDGTFAGLPEGAVLVNRFRISYAGGTGNDITLTDVSKYRSTTTLTVSGTLVRGSTLSLKANVSTSRGTAATGTVTFRNGDTVIGTATLDSSANATTTFVAAAEGTYVFSARYDADATTEPSEDSETVNVAPPRPTVTGVEPTTVGAGQTVTVTVRGTDFTAESQVVIGSNAYKPSSWTSTELRLTWTAPNATSNQTVTVSVLGNDGPPSNGIPIQIIGVPAIPTVLTFEERAVRGPVAPGASSAWIRGSSRAVSGSSRSETEYGVVRDSDNDGTAVWSLKDVLPPVSLVLMVDMTTGTMNVGKPDKTAPDPLPFPVTFLRDPTGSYSHIAIAAGGVHAMLWVRPGAGAWSLQVADSSALDANPRIGHIIASTSAMQPLEGSPAPPSGVERGDLFVALVDYYRNWYGRRVDDFLTTGPGTLALRTVSVDENDGIAKATVVRTGGSDGLATVQYTTADNTALAGVHYQATAGTLTFGAGEIVKTIEIPILDDMTFGGNTSFTVRLSNPAGATVTEPSEWPVPIAEDDPRPKLTLGPDVIVQEGDTGTREVVITATLTGSTRLPVTVAWFVTDPATGIRVASGPLVFAPGETTKTITASFTANTASEPDRQLRVSVSTASFSDPVEVTRGQALITIRDDDPYPELTILDATVDESTQTLRLTFVVTGQAGRPITVTYRTVDGTAVAGSDYTSQRGTFNLSGSGALDIKILGDSLPETAEWFSVLFADPVNATLRRTSALITIIDDDTATQPVVSIAGVTLNEGDSGTAPARFTVQLKTAAQSRVTVAWRTVDGNADSSDYTAASGEVVFEPGQTAATIAVNVHGDTRVEADESFTVHLTPAANVTLANASATGTIRNDDAASRNRVVRH